MAECHLLRDLARRQELVDLLLLVRVPTRGLVAKIQDGEREVARVLVVELRRDVVVHVEPVLRDPLQLGLEDLLEREDELRVLSTALDQRHVVDRDHLHVHVLARTHLPEGLHDLVDGDRLRDSLHHQPAALVH